MQGLWERISWGGEGFRRITSYFANMSVSIYRMKILIHWVGRKDVVLEVVHFQGYIFFGRGGGGLSKLKKSSGAHTN